MTFFAPSVGGIWKQLEGYGIDPRPTFEKAGIDPELIYEPNARIPYTSYDKVMFRAVDVTGDNLFGLKGSEYFRPAYMGALGFTWLASSTLRSAFERLQRYSRMINDKLAITLEEGDQQYTIIIDAHEPSRVAAIREDHQLGLTVKVCRTLVGPRFAPTRVYFEQSEPKDPSHHYEYFRCPLEFDAGRTALAIPLETVDLRLTGANEQLAAINEHIVVKYLAHLEKSDIVNRTKAAIIDNLGTGMVSEASVADQLHMTPRNLHRRLQKEETSFKNLLNEVRQELARQYIADRSLTLTEISFMLGFSEVSSFSRAYKNWTGSPPSAARAAE